VHKAFVDVSEKGTEAAAATGITMRATAMRMPEPPVVFKADHPFLFLIRDTRSGAVLFIGRLMNPR
jgi:serpin B